MIIFHSQTKSTLTHFLFKIINSKICKKEWKKCSKNYSVTVAAVWDGVHLVTNFKLLQKRILMTDLCSVAYKLFSIRFFSAVCFSFACWCKHALSSFHNFLLLWMNGWENACMVKMSYYLWWNDLLLCFFWRYVSKLIITKDKMDFYQLVL